MKQQSFAIVVSLAILFISGWGFAESSDLNTTKEQALVEISKSLKHTNALLETLITPDNAEAIKQLLYSLKEVMGVLSANSEKIDKLIKNSEAASDDFKPVFKSGKQTLHMLKTQTLPETQQLMMNLRDTLDLARELMLTIKQNPTVIIRGAPKPDLGPGEQLHYGGNQ